MNCFAHRRITRLVGFTTASLVLMGTASFAAPFTEGVLDNGDASDAFGQAFGPGIEPVPAANGFNTGDPLLLSTVTFASGGSGTGDANTRLAILPASFYDFNGDPDGSFTPTVADIVGVSDNAIDTTALAYGAPLLFSFGSGLQVSYEDRLSGVFVTLDESGGVNPSDAITPIAVSTAFIRFEESSPGVFTPVANYGGTDNFDATSLFGPPSGSGFLGGATSAFDLSFQAAFIDVPEPGSLALSGAGLALLARRRRNARG